MDGEEAEGGGRKSPQVELKEMQMVQPRAIAKRRCLNDMESVGCGRIQVIQRK
jgi:hypothetical protein